MLTPQRRRLLHAQLRDTYVLLRQFRRSIVLFLALIFCGTLLFWQYYLHPSDGSRLSLNQAFFAAFSLVFFQTGNVPYPDNAPLVDLLYYFIPIIGLGIIGDSLVRFGVQLFNKEARKEEWNVSLASTYSSHVVVCGAGRVGYRVIEQLVQFGESVVAIEGNKDAPFIARVREELRLPLIVADARRVEVLKQANVERAHAIVPCTDNDLTNLEIALNARELNPNIRVVLRMFEPELARKVSKGFGLGTAFSTSALAAPAFAAAVRQQDIQQALYVDDVLVALSPLDVRDGAAWVGMNIGQVEQALDVNLVLHKRDGKVDYRPDHNIALAPGDHIMIFGTLESIGRARRMNESAATKTNGARSR